MKKSLLLAVLAFAFSAAPALAATIDLSPTAITVAPGDTVSVVVSVDPSGATIAAVEAQLTYSSSLLTPTAFTFAPTWIPVTQSGYDQMGGGTLTKTAGYPSGLTSATTFGTITFTAQAAGVATVSVQDTSMAYDTNTHNVLTGGSQSVSNITIQSAAVTPPPQNGTPNPSSTSGVSSSQSQSGTVIATGASDQSLATAPGTSATDTNANGLGGAQTAAAANAPGSGFFSSFWGWLILLLILAIIGGGSWYYSRRNQQ